VKTLGLLLTAGLVLLVGCKKDSKSGTPSPSRPTNSGPRATAGSTAPTGKQVLLKPEAASVTLAPGKPTAFKLGIQRGPAAKGSFTLEFKPAKADTGLTVKSVTVSPTDKEITIHLSASTVGATTVTITGQGEGVEIVPSQFNVEVNN